jgi:hypothetical protein
LGLIGDEAWAEYQQKQARMAALANLLNSGKVDREKLERAGYGGLTATAGLTWAQLLKRPEVSIEPLLQALGEYLARDPLLCEFAAILIRNPVATSSICHPEFPSTRGSSKGDENRDRSSPLPEGARKLAQDEVLGTKTNEPTSPVGATEPRPFSRDRGAFAAANDRAEGSAVVFPSASVEVQISPTVERAARRNEARAVETEIKFAGYLEQQKKSIEKLKAAESVAIPEWIEYGAISGLSREMREKLERIKPITIGQASRIPGVTPAALSLVHVAIRIQGQNRERALKRAAG